MADEEPISVPYVADKAPAAIGYDIAYVVPSGRRFKLKEVEVHFPSGTARELELAIYHGIKQVAPEKEVWRGDDLRFRAICDYEFISGEKVLVYFKNISTVARRGGHLNLIGVLE